MSEDYTLLGDDELKQRAQDGDTAAHFEQGRRFAHTHAGKKEPQGKTRLKAMRKRYGIGGLFVRGLFKLMQLFLGPACVASILYIAYYAADKVYFGYHDYTIVERVLWYLGTFIFISMLLHLATACTRYFLAKRPVSTLLIIAAICWYFYETSPLENLLPS